MFTPSCSVDLLAAVPFNRHVLLDGQKPGTTRLLPPTIGVNYHFRPDAKVSPFVGGCARAAPIDLNQYPSTAKH